MRARGKARARREAYENGIVAALEAVGCSVIHLSVSAMPDLLVGRQGRNFLLRVRHPRAQGDLTASQIDWHLDWEGQAAVVTTETEALEAVGVLRVDGA